MSSVLSQLLQHLYDPLSLDPLPFGVLALAYDGDDCWVTIADDRMHVAVVGGSGTDHRIDLRTLSLQDLVDFFNVAPGFTADLLPPFGLAAVAAGQSASDFGAQILAETRQSIIEHPTLNAPNSVLIQILKPIAAGLRDLRAELERIFQESQIDRADGPWLSDWGDLYGIDREHQQNGVMESDEEYRRRIILEIIHPRVNNQAMRQIIRAQWGVEDVNIEDDMTPESEEDLDRQANGQPWNRMNPFHFWASLQLPPFGGFTGTFQGLDPLITRIKPWGTSWDPLLRGLNIEEASPGEDSPPYDIYAIQEPYGREISEEAAYTIADIHNESLRCYGQLLLLSRPIARKYGTTQFGQWYYATTTEMDFEENPLNNGNADRTMLGPNQEPPQRLPVSILLGPGRCTEPWVTTIQDTWFDVGVWTYEENEVGHTGDDSQVLGIFGTEEQGNRGAETWLPDDHRWLSADRATAIIHPFTLDNYFSRTDSRFSKIEARSAVVEARRFEASTIPLLSSTPESIVNGTQDIVSDFINGVPVAVLHSA